MHMTSQTWTVACLGTGAMSLFSVLLAFATTQWLNLREECANTFELGNQSFTYNYTMVSNAGLWKLCARVIPGKINSNFLFDLRLSIAVNSYGHVAKLSPFYETSTHTKIKVLI